MNDTTKIERAIFFGNLFVNAPVFAIMIILFSAPLLIFVFRKFFSKYKILAVLLFVLPFISIQTAWLYWSFAIPFWKLWAYSYVEDVSKLKRKAIEAKLIWPDNHIFEKTEICSQETRRKILKLEKRL